MPMKPPTTQDSWSSVSERAKVPAWRRSGMALWISASSDSLPSDWASPAVSPSRIADGRP